MVSVLKNSSAGYHRVQGLFLKLKKKKKVKSWANNLKVDKISAAFAKEVVLLKLPKVLE